IVAFTPQFIATSAAVTNDTLTNALFAIFFLRGLALVQRPTDRGPLELGAIAGLASLTKQSGLMLLPLGVLMVCSQHSTLSARAHWRRVAVGVASFLATATLVGGWWYARNAILYGDALGLSPHFGTQVPLRGLRLRDLLQIADSYYATFGWALIRVEQTVYRLARVVALVAAAGVAWSFWPGQGFWSFPGPVRRSLAILATALLLNVALLIRWAVATGAPLGRLLYPSALPIALLAAWGYAQWARWRVGRAACWGVALLAVAFAFVVPWRYLRPAFRSPLVERLPAQARTLDVAFDNGVSVAGYTADPPLGSTLSPGETIHLTLFWSVGRDLGEHYRAWVQLGPRDAYPPVVVVDTWAGGTLYPSGLWRAGDLVRQDFELPIPAGLTEPCLLWVRGGLVKGETRVPLSVPEERQPPPPPESWDTRWQALLLGPYRLVSGTAPEAPCALGGLLAHVRLRHQ
ncbi:MAG: hypothetical protein QME94_17540, partial [Anaerolineae bacterium]|nr:hypothetical protein [Anaerolineae bacterium]